METNTHNTSTAKVVMCSDSQNERYHVLTLRHVGGGCGPTSSSVTEIYFLNPGQGFHGFGGSSSGLVARKTASMIVRRCSNASDWSDVEYDINGEKARAVWAHVAKRVALGDVLCTIADSK